MPPRYKIFNDYESMHSNIYKLLHSKYKRNFKYAIQITLCLFISYILFINKSYIFTAIPVNIKKEILSIWSSSPYPQTSAYWT